MVKFPPKNETQKIQKSNDFGRVSIVEMREIIKLMNWFIIRFLQLVFSMCNHKYKRLIYISYLVYSQIWLNLDHHFFSLHVLIDVRFFQLWHDVYSNDNQSSINIFLANFDNTIKYMKIKKINLKHPFIL